MRTRFLIIMLMTALLTAAIPILADEELPRTNFNTGWWYDPGSYYGYDGVG